MTTGEEEEEEKKKAKLLVSTKEWMDEGVFNSVGLSFLDTCIRHRSTSLMGHSGGYHISYI